MAFVNPFLHFQNWNLIRLQTSAPEGRVRFPAFISASGSLYLRPASVIVTDIAVRAGAWLKLTLKNRPLWCRRHLSPRHVMNKTTRLSPRTHLRSIRNDWNGSMSGRACRQVPWPPRGALRLHGPRSPLKAEFFPSPCATGLGPSRICRQTVREPGKDRL